MPFPRRFALPTRLTGPENRQVGAALLALVVGLVLALVAGLSFSAGSAHATLPGSNGLIACSGPLGPNPPPTGGSFLEIFTMDGTGAKEANGAPSSQVRLQNNTNSDFNPRFNADGTKIAFIKDNNVWKMDSDGTDEVQLTSGGTESFVGGWSPDGTKIVFQSSRDGNFEVYTMNADGTGQTNLTNNAVTGRNNDSQPSWSPDGTKIAFQSNSSGTSNNVHVMNADGSNKQALTADSLAEESAPEWSPDGQQIAFQSDRGFVPRPDMAGGLGRNLEIYRMRADGSNVTRLTFNDYNPDPTAGGLTSANLSGFDLNPHWSPEGDRIVFHSGRAIEFGAAQWDAFTINSVTGEGVMGAPALRLTARDLNDERCGWSVTAKWNLISVAKTGSGEGTVTSSVAGIDCGADCAQAYAPNTMVTLTAAASGNGSTFAGWSGGGCSGTNPCDVTADAAKTVTAQFTDTNPALTVTKAGSGAQKAGTGTGTVTSAPGGIDCGMDCTEEYASGTDVTLTAAPDAGSTFSGFSANCTPVTATTCTVKVDQARTVTATFSGPLLTVTKAGDGQGTVTSNPLGINCGIDCSEDYTAGTMVTLTATVSTVNTAGGAGSTFAGFSGGGCSGTATTCTVTMDAAKTVTATFVDFPTLTISKPGSGAGTVTSAAGGLNCGATCTRDFAKDSVVALTATPTAGSRFAGFTGGGCSGTGTTCNVTMDQAKTVTATFVLIHALSVSRAGAGTGSVSSSPAGISCGADCSETYDSGTTVTLTATPGAGSSFAGFTGGGCSGTGTTCNVAMSQAQTVTATFTLVSRALTVSKAGNGSGTVTSVIAGINCGSDCDQSYDHGTSVTLQADPATGSAFEGFTGAGCSGTGTSCTVTMDQARSVTATFALVPRALSVTKAGTGSGTVTSSPAGINCGSDCSQSYDHGTSVTLSAAPAAGSTFTGWSGGGCSGSAANCAVEMDQARSVTATFARVPAARVVAPPPEFPDCPSGTVNAILGTAGSDARNGTQAGDRILTLGGNDVVDALAGDDCLDLGAGTDRGRGGSGKDLILGGTGNDNLSGGSGTDAITGGAGGDAIAGGSSNVGSSRVDLQACKLEYSIVSPK